MSFLSPLLLFGTVLAAAPIIIHLLNRRRFVRVDWAPMKYLKLTLKSNRRRMQIEQWILLAIRTLAILVLFFGLARPLGSGPNLAGFLKVEGRASRVILIDDSLSMAYETAGVSAFKRAKSAVEIVLNQLGPKDSITILSASNPSEPVVRMSYLNEDEKGRVLNKVRELEHSHVASQWVSTFESIEKQLDGAPFPVKDVLLVTDLWAAGWSDEIQEYTNRWQAEKNISLRLVDVGDVPSGNRVLKSLKQVSPIVLVDKPIQLKAIVHNDGEAPLKSGQAMLTIDGNMTPITLPDIPADETIEIPLTATFESPGQHFVSLSIPNDRLPDDNTHHLVLNVRNMIHITMVDGQPGLEPFESETDFLALSLAAGGSSWKVNQVDSLDWKDQPMDAPDILVLANVNELSLQRAEEIQEMVEAGMGLMIFVGDQADPQLYNDILYRGGNGLMPARMDQVKETQAKGLIVEPFADSPIGILKKISPESLARIRPARFMDVSLDDDQNDVRILARWNTPQQSPALIEKKIGAGSVLFWTTTAGKQWSTWPTEASYVLAMRVAASAIAADIIQEENLLAGQVVNIPLENDVTPQSSKLRALVGDVEIPFDIKKKTSGETDLVSVPIRKSGLYEARWEQVESGEQTEKISVNADISDSTQKRLEEKELQSHLGELSYKKIQFDGKTMDLETSGSELWRYLVFTLLGLVFIESLLAAYVSRNR